MKRTLRMRILSLLLVLTTLMGMSTNVSAFIIAVTTVEEKKNTVLETSGADWTVRAELDRRDIWPEDVAIRAEEVGGDEYIVSTGIVDFTFARFFDIALMAGGEEIQPEGRTVRVEIAVPELEEDVDEIQVVHFATDRAPSLEEANLTPEAELAATPKKSLLKKGNRLMATVNDQLPVEEDNTPTLENVEYTVTEKDGQKVLSFEASGFSVYGIIGRTIEKTVLASDGLNYKITVSYTEEAGIPTDAELLVEEILPERELYQQYVTETESTLGMEEGSADYIRLFDISIVSDDVKVQPVEGKTVDVRITLADAESESFAVVHFADDSETGGEIDNKTESGEEGMIVSFTADGFSVYSVISRENATGPTALDGKSYVLVTKNSRLLMAEAHQTYANRLAAKNANPTVGGTLQVSGTATVWTFEAVEGRPGWYYISDGNGNYINIAGVNDSSVTLGAKQAIYVAAKADGSSVLYQLRNSQTGGRAVNNYNNNVNDGFGAWTAGGGNNEWFGLYDMEFLGDIRVSFSANGGTGAAPADRWGLAGDTITLPDYTGSRNGYTFLGWSTRNNLVDRNYYPVYPAGSAYTIPDQNTTLYAVWTDNNPATGEFYIRLDGTIPYEPDQYDSSAYTTAVSITGSIKNRVWVTDNDVFKPNNGLYIENNVTANLNQVPNADQLVNNINGSSNKLGFRVRNDNGNIVVSEITNANTNQNNYHVSVGDSLYVLWYVQKFAGSWHVDGTLLVKNKVNIAYDGNTPDGSSKNVPLGYQESIGTEITIGASGSKNGAVKTPTRPGYIFLGWNTKPDGSGTAYNNNETYTLNEDTTLYAQWSKGTNMMTVSKTNEDGETLAGAQFKLEEKTASGGFIEKANRTTGANGTFTYDMMENDTLYRMTETYAPNGYEIQNSFYFKVAVDDNNSETLHLHVCDENGNFIGTPDWLNIDYIAADDPRAQGVARIQFNIKDERIKRSITFIKVDEDGDPLPGAEYTLTKTNGMVVSGVLKEQSDSQGIFSVDGAVLPYGTYTLTESKPPVTYAAHEPVQFTLNDYVNESDTGLKIDEDRSGCVIESSCEVSSITEQGLTITTYAYTVKVQDEPQAHIIVTKNVAVDGDLTTDDLDTTIYFALTKKGAEEDGYVKNTNSEIWIETMQIVNGVPTPDRVIFDGVNFGEYDVWEMALIDGEYTRMYNGLVVGDSFQLDSVSASSADGGNNANVSEDDLEAQVDFTNRYGEITQSTSFTAHKKWTDRQGNEIDPPAGAVIEFTLYREKKDASGQIIEGTLENVRSIELDGIHDPDGEDTAWSAVFKYLPIYYEGNLEYSYKVKETVTVDGYYPNEYPQEYYLTSSGGTITNRRLTTDVELHKRFEIYPENPELLNSDLGLTFMLTRPNGTEATYSFSDFTASPTDPYDYVLTLSDLPMGEYNFSESGQDGLFTADGYNLVYSISTAEGESEVGGTEQPVLIMELQNSYAKSGTLVVKKNAIIYEAVDENTVPEEIGAKEFSFVVKRGSLYLQEDGKLGTIPYTFSLTQGNSKTFYNVPTGQYTVIEQDAAVEGYIWEVVDGVRNADGTWSKSLTIDGASSAGEVAFENRYTKIENGSLTVSKTVVGGPEKAETKDYKIEIKTTRHRETVWLDADGNLTGEKTVLTIQNGQTLSFNPVPAGTYIVTEDEADAAFDEYALNVSYSTGSADNSLTIHKDGQGSVAITNSYNYLFTPVKITKTVTGNMGDKNLYFGFDMYVRDAENQPIVVEGVTDNNGLIQFSLKNGEEELLKKLPKGARLTIIEHNVHYDTTVVGYIGVGESMTPDQLAATETHSDLVNDSTALYTFVIPEEGATVNFINDHTVQQTVIIKKVGYDNTNGNTWELAGANFRIYEDEGKTKPVELDGKTEFTTGDDGIIYSGVLGAGTYYLEETKVPDGFNSPIGMFILRISESGVTLSSTGISGRPNLNDWITEPEEPETVYTVQIRNTTGYSLPSTGSYGVVPFLITGTILTTTATALSLRELKRRRREE